MYPAHHILIVEDEPSIVDNICFGLKQEGITSEWVSTSEKALQSLESKDFSLVILDVGLPDFSGFELCKQIRKVSETPIIFLTARNDEIDRILGLEIGGDDYLTKPFSVRELVVRVKVVLRRLSKQVVHSPPGKAEKELSQFGPFVVDDGKYEISYLDVGGTRELLRLTRYEFRLLRVMLESAGRVLTREQLMNRVWEEPEASGERTVDAHIKTLRSKLREAGIKEDYIITHRGIGYSIKLNQS
ncbi:two-component system response regulator CreB [Puniceicoccaceae bacterium K14]|nr:two-component system response regulator CreB [Puniceicoccaceae bacterium K14]